MPPRGLISQSVRIVDHRERLPDLDPLRDGYGEQFSEFGRSGVRPKSPELKPAGVAENRQAFPVPGGTTCRPALRRRGAGTVWEVAERRRHTTDWMEAAQIREMWRNILMTAIR